MKKYFEYPNGVNVEIDSEGGLRVKIGTESDTLELFHPIKSETEQREADEVVQSLGKEDINYVLDVIFDTMNYVVSDFLSEMEKEI